MIRRLIFCLYSLLLMCISSAAAQITIYPIPHAMRTEHRTSLLTPQVSLVFHSGIDEVTRQRAFQVLNLHGMKGVTVRKASKHQANVILSVDKGIRKEGKYDCHKLTITTDREGHARIEITGEHTNAVFCALASLEQLLDQATSSPSADGEKVTVLQNLTIDDYADVQYRGIIEGYYGVPYSQEVKEELFRFMARYKMNTYMYGAKSDPYHSQKWQQPYPDDITLEQKQLGMLSSNMMRSVAREAHNNKVNFIWAIHPGQAFTDSTNTHVVGDIMKKLQMMYDLGVRQFGVFVDDVGVPTDRPTLQLNAQRVKEVQEAIEKQWNRQGAAPEDTVKPLNFVPQLYAYSWVKEKQRHEFYESLSHTPKQVVIYITGANVWSVPNNKDIVEVSRELGRDVAWWWNYPCNDNDVTKLFMRDMYTNFVDEQHIANNSTVPPILHGASALICNPMQQGMASQVALFSVADYAWNNKDFDNQLSYQQALHAVGGSRVDALTQLSGYLTYFDYQPLSAMVAQYHADGNKKPLQEEMQRIVTACQRMLSPSPENHAQQLLTEDLRPWLCRLQAMAALTIRLLDAAESHQSQGYDASVAQQLRQELEAIGRMQEAHYDILVGMGNDIRLSQRQAEPAARVLCPFMSQLMAIIEKP